MATCMSDRIGINPLLILHSDISFSLPVITCSIASTVPAPNLRIAYKYAAKRKLSLFLVKSKQLKCLGGRHRQDVNNSLWNNASHVVNHVSGFATSS